MESSEWVSTSMPYLAPGEKGRPDPWTAETAAAGRRGRQRIVHAGEIAAPPEIAEPLGLAAGAEVVVRRRMMYLDDIPCEVTDSYYPASLARGTRLAGTAKIPGGAVALLAELGHAGARVREDVTARMPTSEERAALDIGPDTPVLHMTRVTFDDRDRPFQVDSMVMPAGRQRLRYERTIG
ncbi:GntR family transcriptional regulator [Streptomyces catenulae]|uniref:UTRA domain-containing protein n=1 Tax=Streptomyces catenulae TaxID=66875 RepID=A0ABV2Z491_9ACTN|nr:UTRA domain-containing protein [Streptomyces catenulae]